MGVKEPSACGRKIICNEIAYDVFASHLRVQFPVGAQSTKYGSDLCFNTRVWICFCAKVGPWKKSNLNPQPGTVSTASLNMATVRQEASFLNE